MEEHHKDVLETLGFFMEAQIIEAVFKHYRHDQPAQAADDEDLHSTVLARHVSPRQDRNADVAGAEFLEQHVSPYAGGLDTLGVDPWLDSVLCQPTDNAADGFVVVALVRQHDVHDASGRSILAGGFYAT